MKLQNWSIQISKIDASVAQCRVKINGIDLKN